ncbi:uncharacterized protein V6R79_014231 [Siganus canaliculatus]
MKPLFRRMTPFIPVCVHREEAHDHMSRAAQQSQKVSELEGLLDVVKTKVQDLEDRCLGKAVQHHSQSQQLQQENQEAQKRCQVLEQKLSKQKEEAAQLQKKLHFAVKEEERQRARQSQTFQRVCHRVAQQDSVDQQLLDVIDFYESKMSQLLEELRSAKGEQGGSKYKKASNNITPSFKSILKVYHDQQKEKKRQIEELKMEVERLKQELEKRPTLKDLRFYKHKVRLLEASNKHKDTRWPKGNNMTETDENISDPTRNTCLCVPYHHMLSEITAIVSDPTAPLRLHRQKPSSISLERAEFQTVLPTLEIWAQQLHLLKNLHRGLDELSVRLMPWHVPDGNQSAAETVKVEDMMLLVDTMLENTSADDEKVLKSPTRYTLGAMVSHFQKLFDVSSLSGVYPRMNEVYTKLGEMTNTMRNLRDVLELDSRVPPAEVVNHVSRLASSTDLTSGVHSLLGDADVERFAHS